MCYASFRKLEVSDSNTLSNLLLSSPIIYTLYFNPFNFEASTISAILEQISKDKFFAIELHNNFSTEIVGFYMLRGLDEGYAEPMYGVFVSHKYTRRGIARLSIIHAECFCKLNNYKKILLKVHPNNGIAIKLYESLGFYFLRQNELNKNFVMYKNI